MATMHGKPNMRQVKTCRAYYQPRKDTSIMRDFAAYLNNRYAIIFLVVIPAIYQGLLLIK